MEKQDVLAALAALAQETRLDVFRRLVQAGPDGLAAGQLATELSISPATLSSQRNRSALIPSGRMAIDSQASRFES